MALNVEKGHGYVSIWVEKILDWDEPPPPPPPPKQKKNKKKKKKKGGVFVGGGGGGGGSWQFMSSQNLLRTTIFIFIQL